MSSALQVQVRELPQAAVIELNGDVSSDGEELIRGTFDSCVEGGASTVLFNLAGTKYINTSGISVLITVVMKAKKAGQRVLVCGASPHYRKVFDLVRFSSFVTMFDTEDEAIASLS